MYAVCTVHGIQRRTVCPFLSNAPAKCNSVSTRNLGSVAKSSRSAVPPPISYLSSSLQHSITCLKTVLDGLPPILLLAIVHYSVGWPHVTTSTLI